MNNMLEEKTADEIYNEAKAVAESVFTRLSLEEMVDFNVYRDSIQKDYIRQEQAWHNRDSGEEVPMAQYKRLIPEGIESKSWWNKIQPIFDQNDGQTMSGFMFMAVGKIIHQQARANPII